MYVISFFDLGTFNFLSLSMVLSFWLGCVGSTFICISFIKMLQMFRMWYACSPVLVTSQQLYPWLLLLHRCCLPALFDTNAKRESVSGILFVILKHHFYIQVNIPWEKGRHSASLHNCTFLVTLQHIMVDIKMMLQCRKEDPTAAFLSVSVSLHCVTGCSPTWLLEKPSSCPRASLYLGAQ